jgi:hypothetical protein
MASYNPELRRLNEMNNTFWRRQNDLLGIRMQNPLLCEMATRDLESEALRSVPIASRTTLETALQKAEDNSRLVLKDFSSRGGRASKPDKLQQFILTVLPRRPQLKPRDLVDLVRGNHEFDMAEGRISFSGSDGKIKDVPISGLKDRIWRAKKILNIAQPGSETSSY